MPTEELKIRTENQVVRVHPSSVPLKSRPEIIAPFHLIGFPPTGRLSQFQTLLSINHSHGKKGHLRENFAVQLPTIHVSLGLGSIFWYVEFHMGKSTRKVEILVHSQLN